MKLKGTVIGTNFYKNGEVTVRGPYGSKHQKGGIITMDWESRNALTGEVEHELRQIHTSTARVKQAQETRR